ncbi:hypothetical protein NZK35_02610 [Stieleria sp. ICT_E10.1]|uniref:hypothetical protein n=1 Tax=Stieleria sedimenti TaxID=2976331 RepID=UPI00217FFAE4|nr:hypothetical protein [Stieleria sedimenti]MCS7465561.1 hypothetical protein [Stieleria sedimenti]
MRRLLRPVVAAVCVAVLFVAAPGTPMTVSATAEEVQLGAAPSNPAQAGFTMFVSTERLGNEGFQPIMLRFRAIGKSFTRQRSLRILFRPRTQYATEIDFQFACQVTVPQGVKNYGVPVQVPHFYRWESCSVQVIEDGRRLGKVASKLAIPASVKDWGQYMSIGVMVPRDAATSTDPWTRFPDLRSIATILGEGAISEKANVPRLSDKQARKFLDDLVYGWARFRVIDEDALQTSWIGYSQLDVILAPYPLLQRIEQQQPDQLAELKRWVSAGGQIWAYAAPPQATPSQTVPSQTAPNAASIGSEGVGGTARAVRIDGEPAEGLRPTAHKNPPLGVKPLDRSPTGAVRPSWLAGARGDVNTSFRYWANPSSVMTLSQPNDTSAIQYQPWNYGTYYSNAYAYGSSEKTRQSVYDDLVAVKHPMVQTVTKKKLLAGLGVMPYGWGRVVLIEQQDPFPGSFQLWKSLEMDKQKWSERNGVDYASGNDSYWAWLMSTVGQPPVTMFVVLNGLFVLVMGPLLYFGLRRRGRLYLLYFLAPALAFFATMGLFCYAFLSDGFDNRARIRQLTWIDGRHAVAPAGERERQRVPVIDQSRQTYYTVVDNQRGLRFTGEAFVLPVHHSEMVNNYNYYPANDSRPGDYLIDQVGDDRLYTGDFLPTRTQVHYLVTRPYEGVSPIEIDFSGEAVSLTNRLPTPLSIVGVCDDKGKYWIARNVSAASTVTLEKANSNTLSMIALGVVDPDSSQMPTPYQNRVSMNDRTGIEERLLEFSRNPQRRSFLALTEVQADQFALRECVQDECVRMIGGLLP